jgi:hypothetical protein
VQEYFDTSSGRWAVLDMTKAVGAPLVGSDLGCQDNTVWYTSSVDFHVYQVRIPLRDA